MLVKIRGTTEKLDGWDYRIKFDMPPVYFDNTNYNICVRSLFMDLSFKDNVPTSQHWSLKTTMVDRCNVNPRQEIASFVSELKKESNYKFVYETKINLVRVKNSFLDIYQLLTFYSELFTKQK